jgi:hypothetical protein
VTGRTQSASPSGPLADALVAFRAGVPLKSPTARGLAAIIENPGCTARRVLDAAAVDKAALAERLGVAVPDEQSLFAIQRGNRFEADVKANDYAELTDLLRQAGLPVEPLRVLPLRDLYPMGRRSPDAVLQDRATATKAAILAMASGRSDAPNLIDGGALRWDYGGAIARLEADGIAWRFGGSIHVVEIKSFPIVDGRGDPEKVGAAAWQAAVYVAAIADMLTAAGLDSGLVSPRILLVCPRNTSLTATVTTLDVDRKVRALRRLLADRATVSDVVERLDPSLSLDTSGMGDTEAAQHLTAMLEMLGTNYLPACLASCPLAFHCRARARAAGDPGCLGTDARSSLAGVNSLRRVLELAAGAPPAPMEQDAAAVLTRARRLLDAASAQAAGHAVGGVV